MRLLQTVTAENVQSSAELRDLAPAARSVLSPAQPGLFLAGMTRAANETRADCLRIIVRAEMKMANEVDAGQARGEVRRPGRHSNSPGLGELEIDSRRLSEWREMRDAGEEVIEEAIQDARFEPHR